MSLFYFIPEYEEYIYDLRFAFPYNFFSGRHESAIKKAALKLQKKESFNIRSRKGTKLYAILNTSE